MFCSACGAAVPENLSFCKFCGAKVNRDAKQEATQLKPNLIVSAMVATFVLGLIANTFLMLAMRETGFNEGVTLGFTMIGFLIMLILEATFALLLFRRKREEGVPRSRQSLADRGTNELVAPRGEALPEPVASVTEHTTRAFAPILKDRQQQ
jgi:hypothetical protein